MRDDQNFFCTASLAQTPAQLWLDRETLRAQAAFVRSPRVPKRWPIIIISICCAILAGWCFLSETTSFGGSYSRFNHLAGKLKVGMKAEEVSAIMGTPESQINISNGCRWLYNEADATTGWLCIMDFRLDKGTLHLSYFCNVEHTMFPSSHHREFGHPIDNGRFDGLFLLKKRRDEWLGVSRNKQ